MTERDDEFDTIRTQVAICVHRWMRPTDDLSDSDVVQIAFVEALKAELLDGMPFEDAVGLLLSIAKRRLANHRRDQGRQRRDRHREAHGVDLAELFSDRESILEEILERERNLELWSQVDELTPEQREAIYLHFKDGLGVTEIARRTGRTSPSVTRLIGRAIRKLGECYDNRDG